MSLYRWEKGNPRDEWTLSFIIPLSGIIGDGPLIK